MIGTHTVKLSNARAKQDAICADIISCLDKRYITSSTVNLSKKYWACPRNAADMKIWRDDNLKPVLSLPDIQDGRAVKQILIPSEKWNEDNYVAVTPLESLGLLHEVYLRAKQTSVQHYYFEIEPTPAARSNHGELLLEQKGKLCLLRRGITTKINAKTEDETSCVAVTFETQNANIGSGFISMGHPPITAVGGLVHAIERETKQDIQFALGLDSTAFQSQRRYSRFNPQTKKSAWGISTELTASMEIVLLLKSKDLPELYKYLKKRPLNRFSGGSIWNYKVSLITEQKPPMSNYLINAVDDVDVQTDSLDLALSLYHEIPPIYSINQVGFAYLENPNQKDMARNGYPHSWAEPIYSMVKQSGFSAKAWWNREVNNHYAIWQ